MAFEFDYVLCWAKHNKMVVNLCKIKEILFFGALVLSAFILHLLSLALHW